MRRSALPLKQSFAGLLLMGFAFASCVPPSQIVVLDPEPNVTPATIGHGLRLSVSASDQRPDQIVGRRRDLTGGAGSAPLRTKGQIATNANITTVLVNQTINGLRKKGFDPVPATEQVSNRTALLELRQLEYTTTGAGRKASVTVNATLHVVVARGESSIDRTYHAQQQGKALGTPSAEDNAQYINDILADVLSQFLNDSAVLNELAG